MTMVKREKYKVPGGLPRFRTWNNNGIKNTQEFLDRFKQVCTCMILMKNSEAKFYIRLWIPLMLNSWMNEELPSTEKSGMSLNQLLFVTSSSQTFMLCAN